MPDSSPALQHLPWLPTLLSKHLPAVTNIGPQLSQRLEKGMPTYTEIGALMKSDPILALGLISQANLKIQDEETLAHTLEQAISLLGLDYVATLLDTTPAPELPATLPVRAYYRSINNSFFAANMAKAVAHTKFPGREDELYWSTLFAGVPFWYLWRFETERMQRWYDLQKTAGSQLGQAELEIFGAPLDQIWREIIIQKGLMDVHLNSHLETTSSVLENQRLLLRAGRLSNVAGKPRSPDMREVRLFINNPVSLRGVCNALAFQASRNWQSRLTDRLLACLATIQQQSVRQTTTEAHQIAVATVRAHPLPVPSLLVQQLAWAAEPRETLPKMPPVEAPMPQVPPATSEAAVPVPKKPEPSPSVEEEKARRTVESVESTPVMTPTATSEENHVPEEESLPPLKLARKPAPGTHMRQGDANILSETLLSLRASPPAFKDFNQLTKAAVRGMVAGIGLPRCIVYITNQQQSLLKAFYAEGLHDRKHLTEGLISLEEENLFARLMEKPASVWIKPSSSANLKRQLPKQFQLSPAVNDCYLMSTFARSKPVACFYADAGPDALPLTQSEYEKFKQICKGVSQVLAYLSQQVKARKK